MRTAMISLMLLLLASACATTSPLATSSKDRHALNGVWEEEWPGQQENDRYRVEIMPEGIVITPLTRAGNQTIRDVYFQHKRLSFVLELDGVPVYYDLVMVNDQLLAGRAKGGARNLDEPVRWYKVTAEP